MENVELIDELKGLHSGVNHLTGDISLQCEGFEIKGGKKTNGLNQIVLTTNIFELFNNVKEIANVLLNEYNGVVPDKKELLIKLPGVGGKTANVFLSNIYDEPAIAVDTHVSRVSKRLGLVASDDDVSKIEKKLEKYFIMYFKRSNCLG